MTPAEFRAAREALLSEHQPGDRRNEGVLNMSAYSKLAAIAAEKKPMGYLTAYENDLHKIDRAVLEAATPADSFVWLLRGCGTELFQIESGKNSLWLTHWLQPGNACGPAPLCYFVQGETVRPITHKQAAALAAKPHPEGHKIRISFATMSSWIEDKDGNRIAA